MTLHVVQRNVVQVRHVGAYIHIYVLHRTPPTCVHICAPLYSTPLHLHPDLDRILHTADRLRNRNDSATLEPNHDGAPSQVRGITYFFIR